MVASVGTAADQILFSGEMFKDSIFKRSQHKNWLYLTKVNCPIEVLPEITISGDGFCHKHIDQDLGSVFKRTF